ncbi:MAG: hypothetical protein ACLRZ9_09410 [Eubacterium sp.]
MSDLVSEIEKSFFDKPITDLTIDYMDIGLDMITNSKIIENIPVVKTFVDMVKTGMSIKDKFLAKKLMIFAAQIYNGDIPDEEIEKRRKAIINQEKWVKKEVEEIIVFLDKFDFSYKALMMGKLYVSFVNGIISSDKYLNMLAIIDKWQKYDSDTLETIYKAYKNKTLNIANGERDYVVLIDNASKQRLESLGILNIKREVINLLKKFDDFLDNEDMEEIIENGEYTLEETYGLNYEGIILAEILNEGKVITKFDEEYFNLTSI